MHATEAALPEAPKTLRGKYLLEDRLGEGGMAVVWRARHLLVERTVAIKVLRPEVARLPNVPQRFIQEARAAWLIDHPNVVTVLDVDVDDDGTPFIVQELLDGEDLEAHLERVGPLSPAALIALVAPALDALATAHSRGVVHRDLKPSNVFLSRTSRGLMPKLLDFGISRIASDDARMTSTGVVMGTPAYMAPEQVHSPKKVDFRADLWAFGVMCYELLSGKLPFEGESAGELLVKLCTADPRPLRDAVDGVPPALESLIMACIRRDPAARPVSAAALYEQLRALEGSGALVGAANDISMDATYIGHRPELPANDASPALVGSPTLNTPANDDARRAAMTAPLLSSPSRRGGTALATLFALGVLGSVGVAWRVSVAPTAPTHRAVAPTPVVVRATPPAAPRAPREVVAPTPLRPLASPPAAAAAPPHARRGHHRGRHAAPPVAPPSAAVIAPPTTPAATPEPAVVRSQASAPRSVDPPAGQDRRVRYTTDY